MVHSFLRENKAAQVNQIEYFGITPIPISIRRPTSTAGASESCDGSVAPLVQPQISSPAPSNPFLDPTVITTTTFLTTQGVWLAEASMRATFPELLPETSLVQMNDNESIMTILQPSFPTNGATGVVMELPRETYSAYSMDARVLVPVNSAIGQEVITVMIVGQAGLTMMVLEALGAGII
ncbi:hypothetical protein FRC03_000636 [Tulasnella sp. 419]|nr:hypothetical protein FRC03_000636 [Tulasnella sp. 419]